MPLYEYACANCGQELEARQRISDAPLKTCPKCGTDALERLVSMSSFSLKGSGWYADGYGTRPGGGGESATPPGATTPAKDKKPGATDAAPAASTPAASTPAASTPAASTPAPSTASTPKGD
ncbi:zinc ribbon domain-containing protein [Myxococcota bacterium]|nr:zinc ribbon domain-containing protein [Myxococcota bacterium]